jgi:tRNA-specific 2-thiouridylase
MTPPCPDLDTHVNSLDIAKPPAETRVVVAMSGGVDSSVVAALLKAEGYDVVGVTLQLYDDNGAAGRKGSCCAGRDIGDARAVAARLGIPHYVLDYQDRFKASVVDPFMASYAMGETPIPCASCNNTVKFTDLLDMARDLGADAMATGHYCVTKALPYGRRGLYRPLDANRDQSYFLYGITPEQLAMVRFPLGALPKAEVRDLARAQGLVNADKPDSQDICFVPSGRYSDLVAKLMPEAMIAGDIVDEAGTVLGRHDGIVNFTVGQRKGLNLGGAPVPLFVTRIEAREGRIVVGPRDSLATTRLTLRAVNWLGDTPLDAIPADGMEIHVRTRSTRPPVPARLTFDGTARIDFPAAETAVSPGQACVFYASDDVTARVLGGGTVTAEPRPPSETRQQMAAVL